MSEIAVIVKDGVITNVVSDDENTTVHLVTVSGKDTNVQVMEATDIIEDEENLDPYMKRKFKVEL